MGTWAKITVITKDKINTILAGELPDNGVYERVVKLGENWDDKELGDSYKVERLDSEIHRQKAKEHAVMYMVRAAARNPRYAFEKMERVEKERWVNEQATNGNDVDAEGEIDEEYEVPQDMTEAPDMESRDWDTIKRNADTADRGEGDNESTQEDEIDDDDLADVASTDSETSNEEPERSGEPLAEPTMEPVIESTTEPDTASTTAPAMAPASESVAELALEQEEHEPEEPEAVGGFAGLYDEE